MRGEGKEEKEDPKSGLSWGVEAERGKKTVYINEKTCEVKAHIKIQCRSEDTQVDANQISDVQSKP